MERGSVEAGLPVAGCGEGCAGDCASTLACCSLCQKIEIAFRESAGNALNCIPSVEIGCNAGHDLRKGLSKEEKSAIFPRTLAMGPWVRHPPHVKHINI